MRYLLPLLLLLTGCALTTTSLRDCKSMCAGKVQLYSSTSEGERCECDKGEW